MMSVDGKLRAEPRLRPRRASALAQENVAIQLAAFAQSADGFGSNAAGHMIDLDWR
jgi:hypothetical protein